jgi:hypothetical protein
MAIGICIFRAKLASTFIRLSTIGYCAYSAGSNRVEAILNRVNVVGRSGSGKSKFAKKLAARLKISYLEIDNSYWEPNQTEPLHKELWPGTGNRESFQKSFFSKESIVWWTITTFRKVRKTYEQDLKDPAKGHIQFIRLRNPCEADRFLETII